MKLINLMKNKSCYYFITCSACLLSVEHAMNASSPKDFYFSIVLLGITFGILNSFFVE